MSLSKEVLNNLKEVKFDIAKNDSDVFGRDWQFRDGETALDGHIKSKFKPKSKLYLTGRGIFINIVEDDFNDTQYDYKLKGKSTPYTKKEILNAWKSLKIKEPVVGKELVKNGFEKSN